MNRKTRRREAVSLWGGSIPPFTASCLRVFLLITLLSGCATVAPQQRAILADPTMQFDAEAKHDAALRHALENREGSMGGTGVSGGGCGCN
jgi:hypothetical protein